MKLETHGASCPPGTHRIDNFSLATRLELEPLARAIVLGTGLVLHSTRCDVVRRSTLYSPECNHTRPQSGPPRPLLITGMGRSGTSYVTSLLQKIGVQVSHDNVPSYGHYLDSFPVGAVSWAHAFAATPALPCKPRSFIFRRLAERADEIRSPSRRTHVPGLESATRRPAIFRNGDSVVLLGDSAVHAGLNVRSTLTCNPRALSWRGERAVLHGLKRGSGRDAFETVSESVLLRSTDRLAQHTMTA